METRPAGRSSGPPADLPARLPARRTLLAVLGGAFVVLLVVAVLVHERLTQPFDRAGLDHLAVRPGSTAAGLATAVTTLGDAVPLLTILIMAGLLAAPVRWVGGWRLLVLPAGAASLAFVLSSAVKHATARPRPPLHYRAVDVHGFSFPSGHATSATAGYVALAVLIAPLLSTPRQRGIVVAAGIVIATLVGVSRVMLGVHWPTDVIAGWALGAAVAASVLAGSGRRPTGPSGSGG